jgi:hypothetical protein
VSDWSKAYPPLKMTMKMLEPVSVSSFVKAGTGKRQVFEGQFDGLARIFRLPTLLQSKDNVVQYQEAVGWMVCGSVAGKLTKQLASVAAVSLGTFIKWTKIQNTIFSYSFVEIEFEGNFPTGQDSFLSWK